MAELAVDVVSYEDLYARWEQGNWKATEIDFSRDVEGWAGLSEIQRRSALFLYSMFFVGEDSVTDNLSPYIDAAPREEQKYFLATQQVDEARHSVFFHRFFSEVIGAPGNVAAGLAYAEPQLTWGFREVFDRLDRMASELRRDRSLPKFAQAIMLYHVIVEATLAQPGQHFIEDFFVKDGSLPGFSEGIRNVSHDEQRHIGFGVKVLAELFAETDECKAAVAELLREIGPYSLGVFAPPNWDRSYTECWGFTIEDMYAFGIRSMESKMKAAGYPIHEMPPGTFPLDLDVPPEERAVRMVKMLEAGILGEPNGRPDSSSESQRLLFNLVENSVDHEAANGHPLTVQWRFSDAGDWNLRIDNGSSSAQPGLAGEADVVFESTWADWVDMAVGRTTPTRAMLTRRVRPRGSLLKLGRLRRVLG